MSNNFDTQEGCFIGATLFTVIISILIGLALNVVIIWAIIKAVLYFT